MQAPLRIAVDQLKLHFLEDIKEKYAGAQLEIKIVENKNTDINQEEINDRKRRSKREI